MESPISEKSERVRSGCGLERASGSASAVFAVMEAGIYRSKTGMVSGCPLACYADFSRKNGGLDAAVSRKKQMSSIKLSMEKA